MATVSKSKGKFVVKVKKGALSKQLGVPEKENIPESKLAIEDSDSPLTKKRKQFAINAKKWGK